MDIVFLDSHAINPDGLSWDDFSALGSCTFYDRTPPDQVVGRIGNAQAVIINKTILTEEIFRACPSLSYVGILATGYNVVDVAAAAKHGVTVTNVPSYSTSAVAQHVFAFIGEFASSVAVHNDSVHAGDWCANPDFCYWKKPLIELDGKTLGIYGFGNIGRRVARIAAAYGMNVLCTTRSARTCGGVTFVPQETLFTESDFLSLHAPLTDQTAELIRAETLAQMKRGAYLINTARGGLVREADVREALESGRLAGYAADVVSEEPMKKDNPLLHAPNCIITPHIAWAPRETRQRLIRIAAENLAAFINGTPVNTVR